MKRKSFIKRALALATAGTVFTPAVFGARPNQEVFGAEEIRENA